MLDREGVGVRIRSIEYPASLARDLKSGLTNRLLFRVTLFAAGERRGSAAIDIAIRYDLWDERFQMSMRIDDRPAARHDHGSLAEVQEALADIRAPALFPRAQAEQGQLNLRVEALIDPIERERMARIRQWVADNSEQPPVDAAREAAGASAAPSQANALFNRIFEQYASGRETAAAWSAKVNSRPFRWQALTDGGP
jgi:hypothetical protein